MQNVVIMLRVKSYEKDNFFVRRPTDVIGSSVKILTWASVLDYLASWCQTIHVGGCLKCFINFISLEICNK